MNQKEKSYYISNGLAAKFIAFYNLFYASIQFIYVHIVQRWSTTYEDKNT